MGRHVLGAVSGLFFGIFLAIDLVVFGVLRLESVLLLVLPLIGLVIGIALVAWSPFERAEPAYDDSASMTSDGA